uniref:Uncharacterized protein n=1 Tax=Setaria viridis TaxID=4556 RepID=A0A4U6WJC2_SETVI|nr:hypothetical protein SEVIR_1G357400v2 [Setaria viridis]TKW42034.1 hypothetical protein SEVIR_1G357400v2 [Setaria viridis]TKW42035.1 hypothetical protein SEVIR_1G357400v2 [Setaria viridis]
MGDKALRPIAKNTAPPSSKGQAPAARGQPQRSSCRFPKILQIPKSSEEKRRSKCGVQFLSSPRFPDKRHIKPIPRRRLLVSAERFRLGSTRFGARARARGSSSKRRRWRLRLRRREPRCVRLTPP